MQIILLLSTIAAITFLTIYGAGIYAWTVFVAAIPLTLAALAATKLIIIQSHQR